jgi:hypothetical protein
MVKYTSAILFAALIAAPALASSDWDALDSRDVAETEIFGRELTETETVYAREIDELFARVAEDLEAREIDIQELSERSKVGNFFKKIWRGIKKVASVVIRREDSEEILARDEGVETRELDELLERYIEEMEERSPGIFQFMKDGMKSVKKIAHKQGIPAQPIPATSTDSDLESREFEEDLLERDLDLNLDLAERDFGEEDVFEREFDDAEDILERDFEEFQEREIDELD